MKVCTSITPIPLPADDTDRVHSMHAALSSLATTTLAFDASMDSLLATTTLHRQRVKDLEGRIAEFRELLRRLDDIALMKKGESVFDDKICMMFSPATYESALLEGMESELSILKDEISSSSLVLSTANNAIQKALLVDVQNDDAQATPSDSWLDQSSDGLEMALKQTNDQRRVPLFGEYDINRETDYQSILDKLLVNASDTSSSKRNENERLQSMDGHVYNGGDDGSVYSITSQMSSVSVVSSLSTRMTAGQRKRWHKQQQMQKQSTKFATEIASTSQIRHSELSTHTEEPTSISAVEGRQQSLVSSHPYLCENLHDSYGIGLQPPTGLVDCSGFSARGSREGGCQFYSPSSHVTDLHVFNTTRNSYGEKVGDKPAVKGTAPKSTSKDIAVNDKGGNDPALLKHTLSAKKNCLVFHPNTNTGHDLKATSLNLPTNLPQLDAIE